MKRKLTEAELAADRFYRLMDCEPGQGPEPITQVLSRCGQGRTQALPAGCLLMCGPHQAALGGPRQRSTGRW
jgi:hypothetical protein